MENFTTALAEVELLQSRGMHFGLEKIEAALRLLKNPHETFP